MKPDVQKITPSNRSNDFETELVSHIPRLRAFARSFQSNAEKADDLVQETMIRAWNARDSFEHGTNMKAWLYTILRNTYFNEFRRKKLEVEDVDNKLTNGLATSPRQLSTLELMDVEELMYELPDDQREALVLVAIEGFSYQEAADICDCAIGTIKSRIGRARQKLSELVEP